MLEEFQNAAEETGIPRTKDFNTGDNFGIGYFQFTTSRHKLLKLRCSAAKGYLNPIKNRPNLRIITRAHFQKINFSILMNNLVIYMLNTAKGPMNLAGLVIDS